MMNTDEDSLICDFAQFYHIEFNLDKLGVRRTAILACGLPEESRIVKLLTGQKVTLQEALIATISDYIALYYWSHTEDGQKGINKPVSTLARLLGTDTKDTDKHEVFESSEAFELARLKLMGG